MAGNVNEPFEIEELDTSNFTEKGYYTLHSTMNNDDKPSSSLASERCMTPAEPIGTNSALDDPYRIPIAIGNTGS
jgi:hypothetical protein